MVYQNLRTLSSIIDTKFKSDIRVENKHMKYDHLNSTTQLSRLVVAPNRRFLCLENGQPFFWLGDTAWWIWRLNPELREHYFLQRNRQGFTLVQVHCGFQGIDYAGNRPYVNDQPHQPNEAYWQTIDEIVAQAGAHQLYVALVPMWGQEYGQAFGLDAQAAETFGHWIGSRYQDQSHVLWIVSGEYDAINGFRLPISAEQKRLFNAVARGLHSAHQGRQLMTIHPGVARASSLDFHAESWLDFNMLQSGHMNDCSQYNLPENYELIEADYARLPVKPVLDGEPFYEDTPDGVWSEKTIHRPRADAAAMRRKAYGAVFSGAFGHTYGHNDVYGFFEPAYHGRVIDLPEGPGQRGDWRSALLAEGAQQMNHLRRLIESRSFFDRVPDDHLLLGDPGKGISRIKATRSAGGTWGMVYVPFGQPVQVDFSRLAGKEFRASWFDPRTGSIQVIGQVQAEDRFVFTPPAAGEDWVLVIDSSG